MILHKLIQDFSFMMARMRMMRCDLMVIGGKRVQLLLSFPFVSLFIPIPSTFLIMSALLDKMNKLEKNFL